MWDKEIHVRMNPTVDIVVPTFNRAHFLPECLDSLLAQTLRPSRIIVVNDGSTDDTASVLGHYSHAILGITLPNGGRSVALNEGLRHVTGDYVWAFDDDDVALPDGLERMITPLERNPQHGFSYSSFYITETDGATGRLGRILREFEIPDVEHRGFLPPLLEANFLCGAGVLARTCCYARVGGFDPQLRRSQDYEWALRLTRLYTGIRAPGGATFHYRQHTGTRGGAGDPHPAHVRGERWRHYDRIFFRRLFRELPLEVYLPPGRSLPEARRLALLQRMAVMSLKRLPDEVLQDLRALSEVPAGARWSALETQLVAGKLFLQLIRKHGEVRILDEVRVLARSSPVIRQVRAQLVRAALDYARRHVSRGELLACWGVLRRLMPRSFMFRAGA